MNNPRTMFAGHRSRALRRGREFLLTFEQWLSIWESSGHFHKRGIRKGQYVMARFGDVGPYAVGNVQIITCQQNVSEAQRGREKSFGPEARANMSEAHKGKPWSPKQRAALTPIRAQLRGKKRPPEVGIKISAAKKGRVSISRKQRRQISIALTGRRPSAATLAKRSVSLKAAWARRKAAAS